MTLVRYTVGAFVCMDLDANHTKVCRRSIESDFSVGRWR
jgi:hypothetical protein